MKPSLITHFTAAFLFSLIMLLVYATVQQTYRTSANDPQLQLARDLTIKIKYARTYQGIADSPVDAKQSLATFVQLYDINGQLIHSGGTIHGRTPRIPKGVLNYAKQYSEHVVTWQPAPDVRLATVAAYTTLPDTAYVVVARSLEEVENREARLTQIILLFWLIGVCSIAIHWFIQSRINKAT